MLAPLASPDSAPLRVIVVDDHPLYREGIVRALEAARQPGLVRRRNHGPFDAEAPLVLKSPRRSSSVG